MASNRLSYLELSNYSNQLLIVCRIWRLAIGKSLSMGVCRKDIGAYRLSVVNQRGDDRTLSHMTRQATSRNSRNLRVVSLGKSR